MVLRHCLGQTTLYGHFNFLLNLHSAATLETAIASATAAIVLKLILEVVDPSCDPWMCQGLPVFSSFRCLHFCFVFDSVCKLLALR